MPYEYRDNATASAGADAHSQGPASVESMRGSSVQGRHRGATRLVQNPFSEARKVRIATLNVGTLTGRSCELAEALERRRVDICAVQETRWSSCKSRDLGRGFKAILCGKPRTTNGVAIIVSQRFRDSIASVERFDDRLMKIVLAIEQRLYHFFSAYAPQTGCAEQSKDEFWTLLEEKTAEVPSEDVIIVAGDLNGHVGATKDGYSCHGGFGYGTRNVDGERILEYAEAHDLAIMNTKFRKRDSHLISFYSGNARTQIDFVLVRHRDQGLVTDAKTVPYETVASQHRPLICTLKITPPRSKQVERCGPKRIKWWHLKEKEAAVISRIRLPTVTTVDETWKNAAEVITQAARFELGTTKPGRRRIEKQAWLWTDDVRVKVREKKKRYHLFLEDKSAGNWRKYQEAKKSGKEGCGARISLSFR